VFLWLLNNINNNDTTTYFLLATVWKCLLDSFPFLEKIKIKNLSTYSVCKRFCSFFYCKSLIMTIIYGSNYLRVKFIIIWIFFVNFNLFVFNWGFFFQRSNYTKRDQITFLNTLINQFNGNLDYFSC